MQFTYEREGNDCWLTDTLNFIGKQVLCTVDVKSSKGNFNDTTNIEVTSLLSYLKEECLTLDNFPGLEDYLKEYYFEVLPKQQFTEKELIKQLIEGIQKWAADEDGIHYDCLEAYVRAKKYINPSWQPDKDYLNENDIFRLLSTHVRKANYYLGCITSIRSQSNS